MKRVIDGRVFDTQTATRIGTSEYGTSGDLKNCYEALFKTRNDRYFIEYHGGPLSRYARNDGPNLVSGSSGIRILSEAEALAWCEQAGFDADVILAHFSLEDG